MRVYRERSVLYAVSVMWCKVQIQPGAVPPLRQVPLDPKVAAFGGAARGVREAWGLEAQVETAVEPRRDATRYAAFAAVALILVAGSLTVALLVNRSSGPGRERPLDAENFADASLVSVLAPYDADGDGTLSPAEASLVTDLDCSGMGLRSLAGIELCVNLRSLDASGNSLTAVDLTELGALEHADLSDNALSSLDVSGHGALSTLDVTDNGMTSLDVSGCAALQSLSCAGNELARLDLSDCDSLTSLWCDEGQNVTVPYRRGFLPRRRAARDPRRRGGRRRRRRADPARAPEPDQPHRRRPLDGKLLRPRMVREPRRARRRRLLPHGARRLRAPGVADERRRLGLPDLPPSILPVSSGSPRSTFRATPYPPSTLRGSNGSSRSTFPTARLPERLT